MMFLDKEKEINFMKKITAFVLLAVMTLMSFNVSFAYNRDNDKIVITQPVISKGINGEKCDKPVVGLNNAGIYVLNRSSEAINIALCAVSDGGVIASTETEIAKNESVKMNVGFTVSSEDENVDLIVKNTDTGEVYTDYESVSANEDLKIAYTNAENNFVIDNDIIFEFNSIIDEIDEIEVKQHNVKVKTTQSLIIQNGKTIFKITPDIAWNANSMISFTMPKVIDIFGRTIKAQQMCFSTVNIGDIYGVYQKAKVYNQAGIGGFAILANFENNTPEKVYFSRTTEVPQNNYDLYLPHLSSSVAMVIDPTGKTAAMYDFSDMPTGKKSVVIDIPYECEGIWQFKFTSSRAGDLLEIGLPSASNWGVRGESELGITETTPLESYIYVPEKVNNLYVGTSGLTASVYSLDGSLQMSTAPATKPFAKSEGVIGDIGNEGVYKLSLPQNTTGGIFIDYAPSLMCPTEEMARNLKGGWLDADGVLVQGAAQKAAREYLIEYISNNDFEITYEKPTYTTTLKYPEAESLFFGGSGAISNLKKYSEKQNFDITSPYCGSFVSADTPTWEDGTYPKTTSVKAFSGLVNMDGELNAFYHNKALVNRTVISVLASMVGLSEELMIKDNATSADAPITHGNFYFSYTARAYMNIRDLIDEKTREVLDNAIIQLAIKQCDMPGRGPSNQWFYTIMGLTASAYSTGNEILKGMLNRHLDSLTSEPVYQKGQSAAGYFIESEGCDGNYHNLCRDLFFEIYETIQRKDPENVHLDSLKSMIQENTEFYSLFLLPQENGTFRSNAASSRQRADLGIDSHTTYTVIMDEFPLAKRRFELRGYGRSSAYERIWKYIGPYANWSDKANAGDIYEFEAYKNVKDTQMESELLPYEKESGIWEKPGIIALKHKGLYMNVFYAFPEANKMPAMSFMGGGITLLYGDDVETVVASRKHDNYSDITSYDMVRASCVFGKTNDGNVFVSGKEKAALTWLEEGKSFKISGTTPEGTEVSWIYTLTDDGINQRVQSSGDNAEMWLNIPISNVSEKASLIQKANGVEYSVDGSSISFDWESGKEYYITELDGVRYLRINMSDGEADIDIKYNVMPVYIQSAEFSANESEISITVKNNTDTLKTFDLIYAVYSDNGELEYVNKSDSISLDGNLSDTVDIPIEKTSSENIKIFCWDSVDSMISYDMYNIPQQ